MIGTTWLHYRIVALLGSGGMGKVYLAIDERSGAEVAIKTLPACGEEEAQRLMSEARVLMALDHPHIVAIHALERERGQTFLVMERIQGEDLANRLRPGGLGTAAFAAIALPLTAAMAAAHARGILHRDLKPGNVMLTPGGGLKLLDFGIGDHGRAEAEGKTATDVPTVVGTLPYMAPEVVEGKNADTRADVFSLGILLHELATGSRPFQADTVTGLMIAILRNQRKKAPLEPSLPPDLQALIDRCLEPKPAQRFPDAGVLSAELEALFRRWTPLARLWSKTRRALGW